MVYAVVNHDDVDPLAGNAFFPNRFDVDVLPFVFEVFQVPLAGIQVVDDLWVDQPGGLRCATGGKCGVPWVVEDVDGVRHGRVITGRHFDIVSTGTESVPDEEIILCV